MSQASLNRRVSLPLLTFYGVGTILGAGIYVLIGEVTLRAGSSAPFSFLLAAIIAAVTAYSFARLSSHFPKSAGEAAYVEAAFNSRYFSSVIGLAVVIVGSVSSAVLVRGFTGYFVNLVPLPEAAVMLITLGLITGVAIWGIGESLMIAALITILEIGGLVFVIYAVFDLQAIQSEQLPVVEDIFDHQTAIFFGAFICFYAFIGFEDIVNLAEETRNPTRVLPIAIVLSIVISTSLYMALSLASIAFVPMEQFMHSEAPLVEIVKYKGYSPYLMGVLSMVAIINGALIQIIMASRVLYGMGTQGMFLSIFATINRRTRTPIIATLTLGSLIAILAISFPLVELAAATSAITLGIFIAVQSALLVLASRGEFDSKLDIIMPVSGVTLNIILIWRGYF